MRYSIVRKVGVPIIDALRRTVQCWGQGDPKMARSKVCILRSDARVSSAEVCRPTRATAVDSRAKFNENFRHLELDRYILRGKLETVPGVK